MSLFAAAQQLTAANQQPAAAEPPYAAPTWGRLSPTHPQTVQMDSWDLVALRVGRLGYDWAHRALSAERARLAHTRELSATWHQRGNAFALRPGDQKKGGGAYSHTRGARSH